MEKRKTVNHIILFGDGGSGKTALINSLCNNTFNDKETATRGINETFFENDSLKKFIDFSGQEYNNKLVSLIKDYKPLIAIFVIDSRSADNFEIETKLKQWSEILKNEKLTEIKKILVINKIDIGNQNLNLNFQKEKFSLSNIFNVSAKSHIGIDELRNEIRNTENTIEEDEDFDSEILIIVRNTIDKFCRAIAQNPLALNALEWRDIERIVAETLETIGFNVELTRSTKDGGKDIIVSFTVNKNKFKYYIEVKHWREGGKPGDKHIKSFIQVNARDETNGGIFISTSGYTNSIYTRLAEFSTQQIKLGDKRKIISLCQEYVLRKDGVWEYSSILPETLFKDTLS